MIADSRKVFGVILLFNLLCYAAYVYRGDYYQKQSDQFYYLSCADNLKLSGKLAQRVDLTNDVPPTATTGAVWIMRPIVDLPMEKIFVIVSFIYVLIGISAFYPARRLLLFYDLKPRLVNEILLIAFTVFPIALFRLGPNNEGPSLAMVTWFTYFFLTRPKSMWSYLLAVIAPVFRAHILIYEGALLSLGLFKKNLGIAVRSLTCFACSFFGLFAYRAAFPFQQKGLGSYFSQHSFSEMVSEIFSASLHLFVSESVTSYFLKTHQFLVTALLGLILLSVTFWAIKKNLANQQSRDLWIFCGSVICLFILSLFYSTIIIARFIAPCVLWMVAALITARKNKAPVVMMGSLNILLLAAFMLSPSTAPAYKDVESVRRLSYVATPTSILYYTAGTQEPKISERQLYGFFRRPSVPWETHGALSGSVLVLSKRQEQLMIPGNCRKKSLEDKNLVLFTLECL